MVMQRIPAQEGNHNLQNYDKVCETFSWDDVKKNFSGNESENVNVADEVVECHSHYPKTKDTVALYYTAPDREEQLTFKQLSEKSSQFANVLKSYGVNKGDRVFLFLPRSPEFYASFFGILKTGAIAGPLFEAFMEQ